MEHSGLSLMLGYNPRGKNPVRFASGRGRALSVVLRWYLVEKYNEGRRVFHVPLTYGARTMNRDGISSLRRRTPFAVSSSRQWTAERVSRKT